jgi:hypothetical protein
MTDQRSRLQKTLLNPRYLAMLPITIPLFIIVFALALLLEIVEALGKRAATAKRWVLDGRPRWYWRLMAFALNESPNVRLSSYDHDPFKDL